jgi:glycosyltransferase involved in cell wall biosynthesis
VRIGVCRPQAPFVRGGVEIFTDTLVGELRVRGHDAELVQIPWQTWPNERVATSALLWRQLDLRDAYDLVIATKFPSYAVEHPNKVVWLVHQLRQAYELHGTELGQFGDSPEDVRLRGEIRQLDRQTLARARRLFATSRNVAARLQESTGLEAEVLPHPPQELDLRCDAYEPFVLSVGRLDRAKRVDLLLAAAALEPLRVVVAGEGPDRGRLEELAAARSLDVRFAGHVPPAELADLYARCRAVYYAPVDEDFGMVPFEAFRAATPVVPTLDAGGPLEVVHDRETGRVVEPEAAAVAAALGELLGDEAAARAYGEAGRSATAGVSWDAAIGKLLG